MADHRRGPGDERTVRIRIRGRVQGVGFRYWMAGEADALGLDGWVVNRPDGSVEALLHGPGDAIGSMLSLAGEGPQYGHVDEVAMIAEGREAESGDLPRGFRILRS